MEPDDNKPIHTISTDITPNYGPQVSDISAFPVGNCQTNVTALGSREGRGDLQLLCEQLSQPWLNKKLRYFHFKRK